MQKERLYAVRSGPRPVSPSRPVLSVPRAAVLAALTAADGPVTVAQVAAVVGSGRTTVREHLDTLVGAGLARRDDPRDAAPGSDSRDGASSGRRAGRGRPPAAYRIAADPMQSAYAAFVAGIAAHLGERAPQEARQMGRRLAASGTDLEGVLTDLGFALEPDQPPTPGGPAWRIVACPLLEAARRAPELVCEMHVGMVEALGGRLAPFGSAGACTVTAWDDSDAGMH